MSDLEQLAQDIYDSGIRQVFGIPGSGPSLTLINHLEKLGVGFQLTHFEGSAVIMAGTQGRLSTRAGAAIGIKGPGLANMIPGIAACHLESYPVVTITEAYPPGTPPSKSHKRLDHEKLLQAVAKGRRFLSEKGPGFSDMADWSVQEAPGPVHLDIAGKAIPTDEPVKKNPAPSPGEKESQQALSLLRQSKKPVIIAGTLAIRRQYQDILNKLNIPIFSTAAAKGIVDETLPQAAGVFTGVGLEYVPEHQIIQKADLVIGLGLRSNEVLNAAPFPCPAINFDTTGNTLCHGFDFAAISPDDNAIENLKGLLTDKNWGLDLVQSSLDRMRNQLLSLPFLPAHAFSVIEQHFNHQARLVLDTGHFCTIGEHIWRAPSADLCLNAGQGRYMGTSLPMALGACLFDTSRPTIAVAGDGGIGMFAAEAKLAVANKLPLLIIFMRDGYLGSIRTRALLEKMTQKPVTLDRPSWLEVFAGMDMEAAQVADEEDLNDALAAWETDKGPMFVEITFDPDLYQKMIDGIR